MVVKTMRLEDLMPIFGGRIRELADRRWLDTYVGGLRTCVIYRSVYGRGVTVDLAVFTPHTRELDPFFSRNEGGEWRLDGELVLPRPSAGFLFIGCFRGILFANNHAAPSVEDMVSALWELAAWARKPWHPADGLRAQLEPSLLALLTALVTHPRTVVDPRDVVV